MRKFGICLLSIFAFTVAFVGGRDAPITRAHAIVPVVAAAGISIGALEALELASATAASVGVITVAQNKGFQSALATAIAHIKDGVVGAIDEGIAVFRKVSGAIHSSKAKSPPSKSSSNAAEGECPPDQRANPRQCCGKFMNDFVGGNGYKEHESFLSQVSDKAWQVVDSATGEVRCCLNWDWEHGRFEVFGLGGDGKYPEGESGNPYDHRGELTCDKIAHDPCRANLPGKADNSGKHAPREGCRFWHGGETESGSATRTTSDKSRVNPSGSSIVNPNGKAPTVQ